VGFETTLGFGGGTVCCAKIGTEKLIVRTEKATSSFLIGDVGKSDAFVFQRQRLSSLSSNSVVIPNLEQLRTWAEVDLAAIASNARAIRAQASGAKVMAVVKANAYGHGMAPVAQALRDEVDWFGVANVTEAMALRDCLQGDDKPIMILGAILPAERARAVGGGFVCAVSSAREAAALAEHGPVRVHLALDTGMGRMGIFGEAACDEAVAIAAKPGVNLEGICSHLPVADEDDAYTAAQLARFDGLVREIRSRVSAPLIVHVENSAGAIGFPQCAGDLVRAGLALYGVSPRPEFQEKLRAGLTWKARIILVRDMAAGCSVSYGRTYITDRPTRVATLGVGYADGYPRQLSGKGAEVLIGGVRCPVLGRVTMDQIMVDVSQVPAATEGEEVVLLGRQGNEEITATDLANLAGTISWHVFTGIGTRVTRVFLNSPPFQKGKPT
jgi:alanine racemase